MRCYNQQFSTTLLIFMRRISNFLNSWSDLAAPILAVVAAGSLLSCGGYNGNPTPTGLSKLKDRVFVSVQAVAVGAPNGQLNIINAGPEENRIPQDQVWPLPLLLGGAPGKMVRTPDKTKTLVLDPSSRAVITITNAAEAPSASVTLSDAPLDAVVLPDNVTAYASQRNANQVSAFDLTKGSVTANVSVPTPRRLVLSRNGKLLLAFSDDSDSLTVINTADNTTTTVAGFDRPVYGIFTSDDSKAFILNCGPECGGTAASVTVLDTEAKMAGASVAVSAASIGLLDANGTLYVAGTTASGGKLDTVSTSNLTVTKSGVAISDGFHEQIALASNNKLFVGARTCNNQTTGCLSIYDTSAGTAVTDGPLGDVTGIQPITGRNTVYVIEGAELRIYDTTTNAQQKNQLDILGPASDVIQVDQ